MKAGRKLRKPDSHSKLSLQEIIGLTVKNANGLASDSSSENCVYLAGCVAVVYNVESGTQSHLMVSHRMPKPLSCVAVSRDGRFVAAGESGNQPSVLVWDSANQTFLSELKDHLYGVTCIAFSPDGKYLVSVGGYIYLWDWQSGQLVTKLKASSSWTAIASVTFSPDAKYIVTAGSKHLKLWSVGFSPRTRLKGGSDTPAMHGKPINLGPQKGNSFISVASSTSFSRQLSYIYALTEAGTLCLMQSGSIKKLVDLKVEKGFALSVSDKLVACACNNGLVKLFTVETLDYFGRFSYLMAKHYNSKRDFCSTNSDGNYFQPTVSLPDAVACQFLSSEKLVVVYGDHSLNVWDIHNVNQATRSCALVSHSASIWDVKNLCCENLHDPSLACTARGCSGGVSFATCSADGTIRLWDFLSQQEMPRGDSNNKALDLKVEGKSTLVSSGIFERDSMEPGISTQGFRSLAVSSDGKYLVAGDCSGNLHIYNLHSSDYTCLEGAHNAEILSLGFSLLGKECFVCGEKDNHYLLTSAGRDRAIHIYDVERNFDLVQSIVDHSAAVTSVKLTSDGSKLVSCSADRSLVVRDITLLDSSYKISRSHHQVASNGTVYDMALDLSTNVAVTVGQDKKINTFDITSGKLVRSFKPEKDFGDPIKVTMDPSNSYMVCSYSNKSICIYDKVSGEIVTQAVGHGEVITGVIFLPDCKHLISVGGEGCIFVWKLPARLSSRMLHEIKENTCQLAPCSLTQQKNTIFIEDEEKQLGTCPQEMFLSNSSQGKHYDGGGNHGTSAFKFRVSLLPRWAQAKVLHSQNPEIAQPEEPDVVPDSRTPYKTNVEGSESCIAGDSGSSDLRSYRSSPFTREKRCVFPSEDHWSTIYTVVTDLKNSPETWSQSNEKKCDQVELPTGSHHEPPVSDDPEESPTVKMEIEGQKFSETSTSLDKVEENDLFQNGNADGVSEQLVEEQMDNKAQETTDVPEIFMKCEENDLFNEHFGSLSASHKMDGKVSTRRRYSSRYVVRWSFLGDRKWPSDSPVKTFRSNITGQTSPTAMQNLAITEPQEQIQSYFSENEVMERIEECSKALLNLATATDEAACSFSDLLSGACEGGVLLADGLLKNAVHLLPSIAEKVTSLARLVKVTDLMHQH